MNIVFRCVRGPDRVTEKEKTLTIPPERRSYTGVCEFLLGKAGADVILDNHPAATCSRKHAMLTLDTSKNEVSLTDMGSSNGTFVNSERVTFACLKDGDEVIFGGGQSIVVGDCMTPEQLKHPMVTVWQVEILDTAKVHNQNASDDTCNSFLEAGCVKEDVLERDFGSLSNHLIEDQVNGIDPDQNRPHSRTEPTNADPLFESHDGEARQCANMRFNITEDKKNVSPEPCLDYVYHTPIRFDLNCFDEIMPRTPYSVKIGSYITRKVKKVDFDESVWKWIQESPNPHEYGQFITLMVNVNEISCIKYNTGKVLEQFQGLQTPFFIRIDINSPPFRVVPDVYLSELAKLRMEGRAKNQLTLNVIFFFKKKSEVHGLIQAIKENYVGEICPKELWI